MHDSIQLPYFRAPDFLPAPLPTIDEIRTTKIVLSGAEEWSSRKVVVLGRHFLVKYGADVELLEGENLLFLEKQLPQIAVPRLYAMWREPGSFELFIVMGLLEGHTLASLLQDINDADKSLVLGKLNAMFDVMRNLPSPGFLGSVKQGPLPHPLFWFPDSNMMTPFQNGADMICALARKSRMNQENFKRHSYLADFYEKRLAPTLNHSQPTFGHSDLQRKNVIVKRLDAPDGSLRLPGVDC